MFPPWIKAGNHVEFLKTEACTINEIVATDPRKRGKPTVGFTTSQILDWFMTAPAQRNQGVNMYAKV
jgi:hypothetical protein